MNRAENNSKGIFITAMGLPSVGKSSVIKELGKLLGCKTYLEPEESYWGQAVRNMKDYKDSFTANMFFRSMRVPYYHEAKKHVDKGEMVLFDTYYDKLMYLYMSDRDNFSWLLNYKSEYFNCLEKIAELDYKNLQNADYLIYIDIEEKDWRKFLQRRGRDLDKNEDFLKSFCGKDAMKDAVERYKEDRNKEGENLEIVEVFQRYDSANAVALEVFEKLIKYPTIEKYLKDNNKLNIDLNELNSRKNTKSQTV